MGTLRRRDKKYPKKMQRSLEPTVVLARGMSARFIGTNVVHSMTPLSKEEVEKDLRHMNAFFHANIAYAQQHYLYLNRDDPSIAGKGASALSSSSPGGGANNNNGGGGGAPMIPSPVAMPVRIDPEEEKRLQNLRKKIALCERQREFLEGQYVSLRAHYVSISKQLQTTVKRTQGQTSFLQTLTARKTKLLAYERARLQMARDVLASLQARTAALAASGASVQSSTMDSDQLPPERMMDNNHETKTTTFTPAAPPSTLNKEDIFTIWDSLEDMLRHTEKSCRKITTTLTMPNNDSNNSATTNTNTREEPPKKKKKHKKSSNNNSNDNMHHDEEFDQGTLPWNASKMPIVPQDVPLYISQLSLLPGFYAAYATNGFKNSRTTSLCWLDDSMPTNVVVESNNGKLKDEVLFLEKELNKERETNYELQGQIIRRRKRSDELVAMMTLLRSETEAVLQRHNVLLDSPQAKQAARRLHEKVQRERASKNNHHPPRPVDEDDSNNGMDDFGVDEEDPHHAENANVLEEEEVDTDGEEGDVDEDDDEDEEGEIVENEEAKHAWNENTKREEDVLEGSASPGRKRRKI